MWVYVLFLNSNGNTERQHSWVTIFPSKYPYQATCMSRSWKECYLSFIITFHYILWEVRNGSSGINFQPIIKPHKRFPLESRDRRQWMKWHLFCLSEHIMPEKTTVWTMPKSENTLSWSRTLLKQHSPEAAYTQSNTHKQQHTFKARFTGSSMHSKHDSQEAA